MASSLNTPQSRDAAPPWVRAQHECPCERLPCPRLVFLEVALLVFLCLSWRGEFPFFDTKNSERKINCELVSLRWVSLHSWGGSPCTPGVSSPALPARCERPDFTGLTAVPREGNFLPTYLQAELQISDMERHLKNV